VLGFALVAQAVPLHSQLVQTISHRPSPPPVPPELGGRAAFSEGLSDSNCPAGPARGVAARMDMIGFDGDITAAREVWPVLVAEVERLKTLLPALI
jgi:hypothetical protein